MNLCSWWCGGWWWRNAAVSDALRLHCGASHEEPRMKRRHRKSAARCLALPGRLLRLCYGLHCLTPALRVPVCACLDRLYNHRDVCRQTCVCVRACVCSRSFPLVKVNVIITEVLMSPDCRSAATPHPTSPLLVHSCQIGTMCCCSSLPLAPSSPSLPLPINCPEEFLF